MSTRKKPNLGKFADLPNPGLRSYLAHVAAGNSEEYRTPFYKGLSPQEVLEWWNQKLRAVEKSMPELYEFEKDLGSKVGPLSIQKPLSERLDDIESYYESILLDSKPIAAEAIAAWQHEVRSARGLRLRSQHRTVDVMKKSTNSGLPYFTKRRTVVNKSYPVYLQGAQYGVTIMTVDGCPNYTAAAVLGWRGQEGGAEPADVKQRVVWMFPFSVNIAELQCYQPLIEVMQRGTPPLVPAWNSMAAVDVEITKLFDTKGMNDPIVCTDFSKFDQHFNQQMQYAAAQGIQYLFTPGPEIEDWLEQVFPVKYNIPLLCSPNLMFFGKHGMASGSGGTNADETIVHRMLQHEAALSQNAKLNPHSQCLGDDGIISYPGIKVDDVMRTYMSHGQEMNEAKQYVSTHDCVYLRRWHGYDYRVGGICVGVYSTNRAIGRLCEQERYYDPEVWSKEMVALRQLSIIENCKYHPLFKEFVQFCMNGDKYRLGIDIPGFLENITGYAEEASDLMPDFLGYTKSLGVRNPASGIADWEVVKILKSLA